MPATEMTSCTSPASLPAWSSTARDSTATVCCPFPRFFSWPLASSHVAVRLLKYSDDDSRLTAGCFVRAIVSADRAPTCPLRRDREGPGLTMPRMKRNERNAAKNGHAREIFSEKERKKCS